MIGIEQISATVEDSTRRHDGSIRS